MSLESYRERVARLARRRDGEPVYNGSLEHAAVIIENMFANANSSVDLLSGSLNARVYGRDEIVEQIKLFLADSDHTLNVLLEEDDADDRFGHPFFDEFCQYKNLSVRIVPEDVQATYGFHFLVMDNDSYRFERDKDEPTAIAAFGDTKGAGNMKAIFAKLWEQSEVLELKNHQPT